MHSDFSQHLWSRILADPEKDFWVRPDERFTYGQLADAIRGHCGVFDQAGLKLASPMMIVTDHDWTAATLWMAAVLDGRVPTVIAADSGGDRLAGIAELIKPELIVTDVARTQQTWTQAAWTGAGVRAVRDPAAMAGGAARDPSLTRPEDGLAYLLFTSGTTSAPKGVMLSHGNLTSQLDSIARVFEIGPESRLFNGLVLFHTDGLIQGPVLCAYAGATLLRPELFDVSRLEEDLCWLRDQGATHIISVPTIYAMIDRYAARDDYFDRPEFRSMLTTSAPIDPELWIRLEKRFSKPVVNEYGMTETVAASHFAGPHPEMGGRFTIGLPVGCDAAIIDPQTGQHMPKGEVGELCLRGGNIFQGYFGSPEETAKVFRDGWFRTGDLARISPEGDHEIVGRMSTAINSGGFLIRPEEIDESIRLHPDVLEAQTVGMKHPDFGTIPISAVVLREGAEIASIMAHCRDRLESQKVPKQIVPLDSIPRRGSGKADLNALKDVLEEKLARKKSVATGQDAAVLDIAAQVFGARREELDLSQGPDEIAGWDSYAHTVLAMETEEHFGIRMSTDDITSIETLGDLAAVVRRLKPEGEKAETGTGRQDRLLDLIRPGSGDLALVAMPDLFGVPFWINKLLPHLEERFNVYGLRPDDGMTKEREAPRIGDFATEFADIIEENRIAGAMALIGYSFGGFLAYETARILQARGTADIRVVILDSAVPSRLRRTRLTDIVEWHARILGWRYRQLSRGLGSSRVNGVEHLDAPGVFPVALSDHPVHLRPIIRQFYKALSAYQPESFDGSISLLRATKRRPILGPSPALGWDGYVRGEVDLHDIDGDHISMLFDDAACVNTASVINKAINAWSETRTDHARM